MISDGAKANETLAQIFMHQSRRFLHLCVSIASSSFSLALFMRLHKKLTSFPQILSTDKVS